jgi:hypothetical protein
MTGLVVPLPSLHDDLGRAGARFFRNRAMNTKHRPSTRIAAVLLRETRRDLHRRPGE